VDQRAFGGRNGSSWFASAEVKAQERHKWLRLDKVTRRMTCLACIKSRVVRKWRLNEIRRAGYFSLLMIDEGTDMLDTWRWTSELHHLELLAPARVRELLVGGADLHACDGATDAPTPLLLARALLQSDSEHEGAQLVVRAAAPWSPVVNHSLLARARAVRLFVLGHLLARERPELVIAGQAFIDVWAEHIMPHALARDGL
jgi:hypothetical protein